MLGTSIALGSFIGTGIQATYAWMGFNRDQFAYNVGWRQNQKYQEKNYHMSWVSIVREDIKEMMEVATHHAASYVGVSSMALSACILSFAVASFSDDCPAFIVFAFYTCGYTAFIFLLSSILIGIKAQHSAYENTMKLLTQTVRPHNPTDHGHNYMAQAEQFEQLGISNLFRVPGTSTAYGKSGKRKRSKERTNSKLRTSKSRSRTPSPSPNKEYIDSSGGSGTEVERDCKKAHDLVIEEMDESRASAYLYKFHVLSGLWIPHVEFSKLSMGLGITCLVQAFCYFTVGKIIAYRQHGMVDVLFLSAVGAFVFMTIFIADGYEHPETKMGALLLLGAGPSVAAVAASCGGDVQAALVVVAFLLHFLFWALSLATLLWGRFKLHGEHEEKQMHGVQGGKQSNPAREEGTKLGKRSEQYMVDVEKGSTEFWDSHVEQDHKHRADKKLQRTTRLMVAGTFVSAVFWLAMVSWAVLHHFVIPNPANESAAPVDVKLQEHPTAALEELQITWPSHAFQPRRLACGGGRIFVSDGLRVFEIFSNRGPSKEVQCGNLSRRVMDLSVTCREGESCQPVALKTAAIKEHDEIDAPEVTNCGTNITTAVMDRTVQLFDMARKEKMYLASQKELVEYTKTTEKGAWNPGWLYWDVRSNDEKSVLRSIGSSGDVLMFFRHLDIGSNSIEIRNIQDFHETKTVLLPNFAGSGLQGGCAMEASSALIVVNGKVLKASF